MLQFSPGVILQTQDMWRENNCLYHIALIEIEDGGPTRKGNKW